MAGADRQDSGGGGLRVRLFDLIACQAPSVRPELAKIHCAVWNGKEHPRDVFLAGGFEEWQRWQRNRYFPRPYVVALIALGADRWLYAGTYRNDGVEARSQPDHFYYTLSPVEACNEFAGRLVVAFAKGFRNSYPKGETCADAIMISELLAERMTIAEFPGYKSLDVSMPDLQLIVGQEIEGWRTALSSVAGVYLISDTVAGRLYVGSAQGAGGIWQRWCAYAATGHGGNAELRALLAVEGGQRAQAFRFSVLEIADTHASEADILQRESHWKRVLLSRAFGFNRN